MRRKATMAASSAAAMKGKRIRLRVRNVTATARYPKTALTRKTPTLPGKAASEPKRMMTGAIRGQARTIKRTRLVAVSKMFSLRIS
jgi:hypothetical protein